MPQTVLDGQGRRILWGWVNDAGFNVRNPQNGWGGMQTLPRVLTLRSDGMLGFAPPKELQSLRTRIASSARSNWPPI